MDGTSYSHMWSWIFLQTGEFLVFLCVKGCATTVLVTSASTGEMLLQVVFGSVRTFSLRLDAL